MVDALTWIAANPDIFLAAMLVSAVVLSTNRIQMFIPGVRELNRFVSAYTLPFVGRLTLPGLLIVGGSTVFLFVDGTLSRTLATGIGLAVILSAVREEINIFPGPG